MKSRRNPFPSSSKKTHQHQPLSKKDKNTDRSPVCSNQRSSHSPKSADGTPLYTDYWPSFDCGSPPGSNTTSHKQYESAVPGENAVSSANEVQQENSVLSKYVERFRHGRPRSREQRQQMASATAEKEVSFWWLSPSSLPSNSTLTETTDKYVVPPEEENDDPVIFIPAAQRRHDRSLSPCRQSLGGLSDASLGEFDDTEILHLQERANRHLLRGERLSEGSIPVSSEGLGSSDFSPPVTVDEPVQRPLIPSLINQTTGKEKSIHGASSQKSILHSFPAPRRPEEDILFQWRLRRKMEQARDWALTPQSSSFHGASLSRPPPSSFLPPGSGQASKQPHGVQLLQPTRPQVNAPQLETNQQAHSLNPPPAAPPPFPTVVVPSTPQPHSIPHVPAHMHLLCDVLPCPVQTSHSGQSVSQRFDAPESNVAHTKVQMKDKSVNTLPNVPPCERSPSPRFASSGAVEGDESSQQTVPVRDKERKSETKESKSTASCNTLQKKPARSSSHRKLSKKKEGNQEIPSERCSDDHKPPPSPIHRAMGKVVSEVLFSGADSPPVSSVSPPCTIWAHSQSSVPPGSAQNSVEVISQLLQEAQDSDEKEFEDDPLLQVLRKQRKRVKEQIREVDSELTDILEEQRVT